MEDKLAVVEEVNSAAMETFASNQKSFVEGFISYNGYIMPRCYLKEQQNRELYSIHYTVH